jgi:hypothetical protein
VFIACHPFLALKPPEDGQASTGVFTSTRTLKKGYVEHEGAPEIESDQIARKLGSWSGSQVLGVATVWAFMFGQGELRMRQREPNYEISILIKRRFNDYRRSSLPPGSL